MSKKKYDVVELNKKENKILLEKKTKYVHFVLKKNGTIIFYIITINRYWISVSKFNVSNKKITSV